MISLLLLLPIAVEPPDFTDVKPEKLGIQLVTPKKDEKTGFIVGGKNDSKLLRTLTEIAGRPIADLEKDMRPGGFSTKGFLGKDEKLLDILAEDNALVVEKLGLTHQQLARHLFILGTLAQQQGAAAPVEVRYHGRVYRLGAKLFRGFANSPFEDGTRTNCEVTVENRTNGKTMKYSLLLPHLIERYGFYEGHGTPYRLDPKDALDVLDFLKKN